MGLWHSLLKIPFTLYKWHTLPAPKHSQKLEGHHFIFSSLLLMRLVFYEYYFNEAASWGPVSHLFPQTRDCDVLIHLRSCGPGPPASLCMLVRAGVNSSVKDVVHTLGRYFLFLAHLKHGIALGKLFLSDHFKTIINSTSADAPDTK